MIPRIEGAMDLIIQKLRTSLASQLSTPYDLSDLSLITGLLNALNQELNKGAEVRVRDIEQMKEIFSDAVDYLPAGVLKDSVQDVITLEATSLVLKDLNDLHDECTKVLIELHAWVEDNDMDDWASGINVEIWTFLDKQAGRYQIESLV